MTPTGQNVFILPDWDKEEMSPGGIHLPKCRVRDLPNTGVVVGVPDKGHSDFAVGAHVVYNRFKQQLTEVPGFTHTLTIVKVEDVLALVLDERCYLHNGEVAADWLSIPCAPGGRIYICEACANDPDIVHKIWPKYQKEHHKHIRVFKAPLNTGN